MPVVMNTWTSILKKIRYRNIESWSYWQQRLWSSTKRSVSFRKYLWSLISLVMSNCPCVSVQIYAAQCMTNDDGSAIFRAKFWRKIIQNTKQWTRGPNLNFPSGQRMPRHCRKCVCGPFSRFFCGYWPLLSFSVWKQTVKINSVVDPHADPDSKF
jgi:hypothetical protein